MSTKFDVRTDPGVVRNYGRLLVDLSTVVPDGIVCFFVSYSYMDRIVASWHESGILAELMAHKLVFIETQDVVETRRAACGAGCPAKGAVPTLSFALSITLSACAAWLWTTTGAPATPAGAPSFCPSRAAKSQRASTLTATTAGLSSCLGCPTSTLSHECSALAWSFCARRTRRGPPRGWGARRRDAGKSTQTIGSDSPTPRQIREQDFLSFDAIRQAAQCVGRVIRSKADYGLMIFADKRYNSHDKRGKLPGWITAQLKEAHLNLSTDMALHVARTFCRAMAQPYDRGQAGKQLLDEEALQRLAAAAAAPAG